MLFKNWKLRLILSILIMVIVFFAQSDVPVQAVTRQFRGMNWAVLGDNFKTVPLVIQGLSSSDSYATVQAKANALYDDMSSTMGVNTVRLPINTHTVGTTWWSNYRGAIDAATGRGWKVILAYWEDGAASGGRITNTTAFHNMWDTVVSQYGSNTLVYFEPMNEPHGYSSTEWRNFAADWLNRHIGANPGRVLIGGTGYSQDLRDLCGDTRFSSTLFSFHYYAFFYSAMTYDAFLAHIQTLLSSCASRAVMTEFGAPMATGLNYADANSTDNFVRYLRAVAQVMRNNQMGGTYWPALGGKVTAGTGTPGYDHYSMYAFSGSGTNLNLTIRNNSGRDRVLYGWGDGGTVPTNTPAPSTGNYYRLTNRNSGKVADVSGQSTADGGDIVQWTWNSGNNQQWEFRDLGTGYFNIVNRNSGKCMDVSGASVADGADIIQWTCGSGTNQQWQWVAIGSYFQLKARHSGKCMDVSGASVADGADIIQWTCGSGTNQQWSRTAS